MIGRKSGSDGRPIRERDHFVLELTHNYGIESYSIGNALRHLEVDSRFYLEEQPGAAADPLLLSPDGYPFYVKPVQLDRAADSGQSLRAVSLVVSVRHFLCLRED